MVVVSPSASSVAVSPISAETQTLSAYLPINTPSSFTTLAATTTSGVDVSPVTATAPPATVSSYTPYGSSGSGLFGRWFNHNEDKSESS